MQIITRKGLMRCWGACVTLGAALLPAAAATNAVEMVTYFPVPYARYNNLYIQNKLDIGTVNQPFELTTGNADCNASNAASFKATNINLRNVRGTTTSPFPTLKISQDFASSQASFGNTQNTGTASVSFTNLYLQGSGQMSFSQVKANKLQVEKADKIYMLKNTLPGCTTGKVTWAKLNFKNSNGVVSQGDYLVCCDSTTFEGCRKECVGYDVQQNTCKNGQSGNTNVTLAGAVSGGTWTTTTNLSLDDSCYCSCSNVTYTASGSNQKVTGGKRIYNNAMENSGDYDYCQEYCWTNYTNGDVAKCKNSHSGALWHYGSTSSQCYCDCSQATDSKGLKRYKNVGGECKHYCYKNINNGDVERCENSGGTWTYNSNDSKCKCTCPTHFTLMGDNSCQEKCESGAPNWGKQVTSCNNTKGDGSGWNTSNCSCNCGKKNGNAMTWGLDGGTVPVCKEVPAEPEEPTEPDPEPEPQEVTCNWTSNGRTQGPPVGSGTSCGTHPAAGTPSDCSLASCTTNGFPCIMVNSPSREYDNCYYPMQKCVCK